MKSPRTYCLLSRKIRMKCELYFFFQAEDGIRDKLVTGVQTCALPIYTVTVTITITGVNDAPVAVADNGGTVAEGGTLNGSTVLVNDTDAENNPLTAVLDRSEERRVGKECRTRWSPYDEKQNEGIEMVH